jgi:hypothetical protein
MQAAREIRLSFSAFHVITQGAILECGRTDATLNTE